MMVFKTKLKTKKHKIGKFELIGKLEDDGQIIMEYPTDSFDGSNTGDGVLYKLGNKYYEVNRERFGTKVQVGEIDKRTLKTKKHKIGKFEFQRLVQRSRPFVV